MNIHARCGGVGPKVTHTGMRGLLLSRRAEPWGLTRGLASSRWSRVPSSRLAGALYLRNVNRGVMICGALRLRGCDIVPLNL